MISTCGLKSSICTHIAESDILKRSTSSSIICNQTKNETILLDLSNQFLIKFKGARAQKIGLKSTYL